MASSRLFFWQRYSTYTYNSSTSPARGTRYLQYSFSIDDDTLIVCPTNFLKILVQLRRCRTGTVPVPVQYAPILVLGNGTGMSAV